MLLTKSYYQSKGYFHFKSVLNSDEVIETRKFILNDLVENKKDYSDLKYLINKYPKFYQIFSEKIDSHLKEINENQEIFFVNVIKIQKNVLANNESAWHQDSGKYRGEKYFTNKENFYCKLGIYLQDNSKIFGGGIDLVPYSHLPYIEKKFNIFKKIILKFYTSFRIRFFDNQFKIKKGDAIFFHNKLFHKTSSVKSKKKANEHLKNNSNINLYVIICNKALVKEIFKFNNLEFNEKTFYKEYSYKIKQNEDKLPKYILNDYLTQLIYNSLSN